MSMWKVIGAILAFVLFAFLVSHISSRLRKSRYGREEWTADDQITAKAREAIELLQSYVRSGDNTQVRRLFDAEALDDLDGMDEPELREFPGARFTNEGLHFVHFLRSGLNVMITSEPLSPDGHRITASLTFPYEQAGRRISEVALIPEPPDSNSARLQRDRLID